MKLAVSKVFNYAYLGAGFVREAVADLFSSRLARGLLSAAVGLNILSWLAVNRIAAALNDDLAVLHYNVIFGIDLIGDPVRLYLLPLFALCVIILNFIVLALISGRRDRLFTYFALGSAIAINISALVAIYFVYLINFS